MPSESSSGTHDPPAAVAGGELARWMLDPAIRFLNHGCFGARPRVVHEARLARLLEFEGAPVRWLDRERTARVEEAKVAVGAFLGMRTGDFGFVTNATGAVCAVLRSLAFEPGDGIVSTTHTYNAVRLALEDVRSRTGADVRTIDIPAPFTREAALDAILGAVSRRTRLVVVDHVTSPTAIVLPVEEIVARCGALGVDVLVDGAHAPGMLDLDVESIGAAYYAGNLHKWVCAPPGAAFLRVAPDRQEGIHPSTISHFYGEGIAAELGWQGTRDITPWLTAPDAIAFMDRLDWARVRAHNHGMAAWAQRHLAGRWGVEPVTPLDGSLLGSMVTLPLPEALRACFETTAALQAAVMDLHAIEVPVIDWSGRWWIRVSCQVYNTPSDYERLGDAIADLACGPQVAPAASSPRESPL